MLAGVLTTRHDVIKSNIIILYNSRKASQIDQRYIRF